MADKKQLEELSTKALLADILEPFWKHLSAGSILKVGAAINLATSYHGLLFSHAAITIGVVKAAICHVRESEVVQRRLW